MNIEKIITLFLNNFTGKYFFLDSLIYFLAQVLPFLLLFFLIYLLARSWKRNLWIVGGALFAGIFARYVLVEAVRRIVPRLRPFHLLTEEINLILPYKESLSFPSGHISFFFAVSTVIYLENRKMGIVFYCLSFVMGISRVFAGMHWPLDVLVGALLGIIVGIFVEELIRYFKRPSKK